MKELKNKKKLSDIQIGSAIVGAGLVVGYFLIKRRMNIKTGKMLLLAAEGAVNEWVAETEKNGFKVLVLSNSLVEQLTEKGMTLIPAA